MLVLVAAQIPLIWNILKILTGPSSKSVIITPSEPTEEVVEMSASAPGTLRHSTSVSDNMIAGAESVKSETEPVPGRKDAGSGSPGHQS